MELFFLSWARGVVRAFIELPPVLISNSAKLIINASSHSFGPKTVLHKHCIKDLVLRKVKDIVIGKKKKRSAVYCVLRHVMHCCCTTEREHHFIYPRYFPFDAEQLFFCMQRQCGLKALA